jgi:hypothetical protein
MSASGNVARPAMLADILAAVRRNNPRVRVSGTLLNGNTREAGSNAPERAGPAPACALLRRERASAA